VMSTAATASVSTPRWLPSEQFRAMGFEPGGPEIDYGMRWGERGDIRVSFAPHGDHNGGFLYAHDPATDRCLLLAAHTTADRVGAAWRELISYTVSPDGYLALASLDHDVVAPPMSVGQAQGLLLHCLDRELIAYQDYVIGSDDVPTRGDAAFGVIVQRSARVSAEQLLVDAARAEGTDAEPVVIRYRMLEEPGWSGSVAGVDLESARLATKNLLEVARRHHLTLQATSVTHGHSAVSAARVPELALAATRPSLAANVPTIGI
jgi:hypothetical protein